MTRIAKHLFAVVAALLITAATFAETVHVPAASPAASTALVA
jgi:hypothetical protein